jgi:hypothetical protein
MDDGPVSYGVSSNTVTLPYLGGSMVHAALFLYAALHGA